jgi:hypothetical protein
LLASWGVEVVDGCYADHDCFVSLEVDGNYFI